MSKQYYIQVIADNYLKNIMPDPVSMKVHTRFLHGLDMAQFKEGFLALLSLMRSLYADISHDPGGFGMTLKENTKRYENNPDYRNSDASFLRMPHVLLILGAEGVLQSDLTLTVNGDALLAAAKALKIPNTALSSLLAMLRSYGFEINGLGKSVKTGDVILLSHIDCRALTVALKAMSDALLEMNKGDFKKPKYLFWIMHPGILENEIVKEPKLTVDAVFHAIDPINREYASALHMFALNTTRHIVRSGSNGGGLCNNLWTCTYTGVKNKKVLFGLHVNQGNFYVKLNLYNIGRYMHLMAELPEKMQVAICVDGWGCGGCNSRCGGGFVFEMDGERYDKCRCGSFIFKDLTAEDIAGCKKLLEAELAFMD